MITKDSPLLHIRSYKEFSLYFEDESIHFEGYHVQQTEDWCVYVRHDHFVWYCLHTRKEISSFPSPFGKIYPNNFQLVGDLILVLREDSVFLYNRKGECQQQHVLHTAATSIYLFDNFFAAESKVDSWCWHIYRLSPFAHLGDAENLITDLQWIHHGDDILFSLDSDVYRIDRNNSDSFQPYVCASNCIDALLIHDDKLWIQNSSRGDYWPCPLVSFDFKNNELRKTTKMDAKLHIHRNMLLIWTWVNNPKLDTSPQWFGCYKDGAFQPLWYYPKGTYLTHVFCIDTEHYGVITSKRDDRNSILQIIGPEQQVIRSQQLGDCDGIMVEHDLVIIIKNTEIQRIPIDSLIVP